MGHSTGSGRASRTSTANAMLRNGELAQDTYGQLAMRNFSDEGIQMAVDRNWIDQNTADQLRGEQSTRGALSFRQRAQAIRDMAFEEYGSGSRAIAPGVGEATVTRNATTGRYEGEFRLEREGVTKRLAGSSETLRQMEIRVRVAMSNRNLRGNSGRR